MSSLVSSVATIVVLAVVCVVSFAAAYAIAKREARPAPSKTKAVLTPPPRPPVQRTQITPRRPAPPIPRSIPLKTPKPRTRKEDGVTRVKCACGKAVALTKLGRLYTHQIPGTFQRQCSHGGTPYVRYVIHEDPV